ncbi:MAG: FtsX-like permease family protein, partial [Terriglobales bacterium]
AMLPAPLRRPLAAHGGALAWDGRVLATGLALIAVAALLSGLAPAWSAARGLDETALRSGPRPLMGSRRRGLRLLVAAECLLAMLLLAGAALMLRTWTQLRQTSLGFDVNHVVLIGPCVPTAAAECAQLARRAAASPGVSATGATDDFPLGETTTFVVASTPAPHPAVIGDVSAGYFRAMGMTIAPGRGYGPGEAAAAVVSIGAARVWWPGQSAVGQHFTFNQHVYTVVGVVPDVERTPHRSNTLPFQPPQFPQIYVPPTAAAPTPITVIHAADAATLAASLRAEARQAGARQAAAAVTTGAAVLAGHMQTERGMASLLGLFAGLALAVAAGGVFTLMAFAARTRRQEAGIRLALGAAPARLAWQFGREGLLLALAGVALGLAMVTRLAQPLLGAYLYGVRPTDAATLASAAALLVALAAAACALPAFAAARTDPAQVLRQE